MSGPRDVVSRREALAQLAALVAYSPLPPRAGPSAVADPLDGTSPTTTQVAAAGAGPRSRSPRARSTGAAPRDRAGARSTSLSATRSPKLAPPMHACARAGCAGRSMAFRCSRSRSTTWTAFRRRLQRRVGAAVSRAGSARRARGRAAARGRRRRSRKDRRRRLRLPRQRHEQPHRAGAQSVRPRPDAHAGRLERRARPSPSRAGWRSPRSAPTTAAPTASRRSSPASWA